MGAAGSRFDSDKPETSAFRAQRTLSALGALSAAQQAYVPAASPLP